MGNIRIVIKRIISVADAASAPNLTKTGVLRLLVMSSVSPYYPENLSYVSGVA